MPLIHICKISDNLIMRGLLRYLEVPYPQGTQALHHHLLKRSLPC